VLCGQLLCRLPCAQHPYYAPPSAMLGVLHRALLLAMWVGPREVLRVFKGCYDKHWMTVLETHGPKPLQGAKTEVTA
jgi:hypothetical protein